MQGTKWVFITGGVLSGLGKGLVSASIGRFLQSRNYKVVPVKCDGYLNVDPGTMNPIEHGEVFVLEDGGEVDMDFGHYERFLGTETKFDWNLTSGKIFQSVIEKERSGDYLGKTVQMIPHVTDEIRHRLEDIADNEDTDVVLVEIGGTVGDLENMIFLEAARQMRLDLPEENTCLVHVTLVPWLESVGEQKTKPTQHSVKELDSLGLEADIIVGRADMELKKKTKEKISLFCNVPEDNVVSNPDVEEVYKIPLNLKKDGLDRTVVDNLNLTNNATDMERWGELVENLENPTRKVDIAICGKYTSLEDSYVSILESLKHCSAHLECRINHRFIDTTDIEETEKLLGDADGVIIPGGFGRRGAEGKIEVARHCRENKIPILGLCYGLQLMVTEFARNKCGLGDANSTEVDEDTEHPVVDLIPEQKDVEAKGGTMRLGGESTEIEEGSMAKDIYNKNEVKERFRHRYEVNPEYHDILREHGLRLSGFSKKEDNIVQIVEMDNHPFYLATQFHPEFKSTFEDPSPVFIEFVKSCIGD